MENSNLKSPPEDSEPDSPNPIQPTKPLSFSNGVLKLRTPHAPHAPPYDPHASFSSSTHNEHSKHHAPPPAPGTYMECLKNHAAAMGGNAVDGCGEYMPSATSLLCAACGCHRNFHRLSPRAASSPHAPPHHHLPLLEYRPHRRHRPSPPRSPSPPPISSSYMLLSLSSPNPNPNHNNVANPNVGGGNNNNYSKKRFRTRFTPVQKEKMYELAERLTWKMQRRDEEMISGFCERIGVEKGVFKVWMHNNKNTRGKKDAVSVNEVVSKGNGINLDDYRDNTNHNSNSDEVSGHHVGTNGSSSCS